MRRLNEEEKREIKSILRHGLDSLLKFKASVDLLRYLGDRAQAEYSRLEVELHSTGYPLKGTGICAKRGMLTTPDLDIEGQYYFSDVDLNPEQHVSELGTFALDAAAASYSFGVLEDIGNTVVEILTPGKIPQRSSWHAKVYGDTDVKISAQLNRARDGFANAFGVVRAKIPALSTKRLVWLKARRNAYVHDLDTQIEFDKFFQYVIILVCQIEFLALPSVAEIKRYPFEDHWNQFT